ncbi:hypothetical protein L2E82_35480 [Cichorium intybus]|uniref:Uncharacterized protein n=1 Tax=Cichorium intybus TaxID=13427 RepID=A0ACB9BNZ2_CICIN|nr:hypothetical protein L2E82_35480 [Cichorium intybus]
MLGGADRKKEGIKGCLLYLSEDELLWPELAGGPRKCYWLILLVPPPQATAVGSMYCIVCPDEGCILDGASPLTGDGSLVVPVRGKTTLKVTKESTSFENGESK